MSVRELANIIHHLTLMHSFLQAESITEMAVMNHRPAVIDGVLKEILDWFHFQSLWSGASWQLPSPLNQCCYFRSENNQFSAKQNLNCEQEREHLVSTYSAITEIFTDSFKLIAFTSLSAKVLPFPSIRSQGCMAESFWRRKHICFSVSLFIFFIETTWRQCLWLVLC